MYDKDTIQKIIENYVNLGNTIVKESAKFKNKLGQNYELDSTDLETLSQQIDAWIQSLGVLSDKLNEIMTSRDNSI